MGWDVPWYWGINVSLRDGDQIYRSDFTTARAAEELSSVWALLDITPFGRQQEWQDAPEGVPQDPTYSWGRRHDEYSPETAARIWFLTIEHVTLQRMEHVGIVVDDLAAAAEFFVELGLVRQGEWAVEGRSVDRVVGLDGVRTEVAMMQTPDGNGRLELVKFHSPSNQGDNRHAPANTPGIRHIAFAVEDIDAVVAGLRARGAELVGELERYEDSYRLCYVRGPNGIIIELAEQIG